MKWLVIIAGCFFSVGCREGSTDLIAQKLSEQRPLMGTLFQVTTYATDLPKARETIREAFDKAAEIEKVASDYSSASELNQICQAPSGKPVGVSPLLFGILTQAMEVAEKTGGQFDPTLGPLTRLWRETRKTGVLPEVDRLHKAKMRCGYENVILDKKNKTITLRVDGVQLDLGGIAKGYAADIMFTHLQAGGFEQTLIAAGGDLRFGKAPPGKKGWTIGLQTFHLTPGSTIELENAAVSTSGDLHQSVTIEGIRYSHLMNQETGLGMTDQRAATVIASKAVMTDSLATAACVTNELEQLAEAFPACSFRVLFKDEKRKPLKSGRFLRRIDEF